MWLGRCAWGVFLCLGGAAASCADDTILPLDDGLPLPARPEERDGATPGLEAGPTPSGVDAGNDAPSPAGPRVFVTSTTTNARLGGLAGADARCADVASAAGIGGSWVAWLSVENGPHAIDRLTSIGPWHVIGGGIVTANKTTLAAGTLERPIDRDERGVSVPPSHVWTGTGPNGRYLTNDCDKWTPGGNRGRAGATDQTTAAWTSATVDECNLVARLYCFER